VSDRPSDLRGLVDGRSDAVRTGHVADQVQGKHGRHTYSLAEFDLERGPIDERLARYWARYDLPASPPDS